MTEKSDEPSVGRHWLRSRSIWCPSEPLVTICCSPSPLHEPHAGGASLLALPLLVVSKKTCQSVQSQKQLNFLRQSEYDTAMVELNLQTQYFFSLNQSSCTLSVWCCLIYFREPFGEEKVALNFYLNLEIVSYKSDDHLMLWYFNSHYFCQLKHFLTM